MESELFKCVICEKDCYGYGNNALPLASGECCDECNDDVISARLSDVAGAASCDLNLNISEGESPPLTSKQEDDMLEAEREKVMEDRE